jgi:AcrR family transcriptional regulator
VWQARFGAANLREEGIVKKMARDLERTKAKILQAVGQLFARSGFRKIGINVIAREAGVDKVLIYRYFGGLPALLKTFADNSEYWPNFSELTQLAHEAGEHPLAGTEPEWAKQILVAFGRALRKRPLTQEIMRWELLERNEITDALARRREEQADQLFQSLGALSGIDPQAIGALLAAGQTYLILRSKTVDTYNGLHLNSEEDWARIERAVRFLVDAAAQMSKTQSKQALPKRSRKRNPQHTETQAGNPE